MIFILLSIRGYAQFTWEHTDGPFGSVLSILYANDDFIFSPEDDFIFRSADGIHWEKLNHPGTIIFAVTNDTLGTLVRNQQTKKIQLHLSLDNGENWIIRDLPAPFTDYNVNIVFSGSIISLGNFNHQSIFRSEDFGLHWTEHPYPVVRPNRIKSDKKYLYSWDGSKLMLNHLDSTLWRIITPPLASEGIGDVQLVDSIIILSTDDHIWTSYDKGGHWLKSTVFPLDNFYSYLTVENEELFSLTDHLLIYSADAGLHWDTISSLTQIVELGPICAFKNNLFSASTQNGIFRWDNADTLFVESNDGLSKGYAQALAFNSDFLFAACPNGIFRYDIEAQIWKVLFRAYSPFDEYGFIIGVNDNGWVVVGDPSFRTGFISTDGGVEWDTFAVVIDLPSFDIDKQVLLLGENIFLVANSLVHRSTDKGLSWEKMPMESVVSDMVIIENRSFVASKNRIYSSNDLGINWSTNWIPFELKQLWSYGGELYAYDSNVDSFRIYVSMDGLHWELIGEGPKTELQLTYRSVFFRDAENYYIFEGINSQYYYSANVNSLVWSRIQQPFFGPTWLNYYLVADDEIYFGGNGVYKTIIENPYITNTAEPKNEKLSYFNISPNPVTDVLHINFGKNQFKGSLIQIYETDGKLRHSESVESDVLEFPLDNFAPGLYQVVFKLGDFSEVHSFIKQ